MCEVLSIFQGKIGVFSFLNLLITLVSGIALLKFAGVLLDVVALKLLPQKGYYK